MECWNNGMMEYWVWRTTICFYIYMDGMDQKIKSGHDPILNPNIPIFQYSSIPSLHWFSDGQNHPSKDQIKARLYGLEYLFILNSEKFCNLRKYLAQYY